MSKPSVAVHPGLLRQVNERAVVAALRGGDDLRVAELAAGTGLTRASVTAALRDLVGKGWVEVHHPVVSGRGRPAARYRIRDSGGRVLGIDIGAHAVRACVTDLAGRELGRDERAVTPSSSKPARWRAVAAAADGALSAAAASRDDVWATLVASTGTVDEQGIVTESAAIPGWAGVDLVESGAAVLPGAVMADNDVRTAAWAEYTAGAGRDSTNMMLVVLGRRPALSVIVDGVTFAGAHAVAGDLSRTGLLPEDSAAGWPGHSTARDPFASAVAAVDAGDRAATTALTDHLGAVAPVISLVTAVIDPDTVVVGGPLAALWEVVRPVLAADLVRHCQVPPTLVAARFDRFATALGAALLAVRQLEELLLDSRNGPIPTLDAAAVAAVVDRRAARSGSAGR